MLNKKNLSQNRKKGDMAENIAISYLENLNYKIICKNFYTIYGEIDIIAEKQNVLTFFEVKYRKSIKNGYPRESVNKTKQEKIKNATLIYISENNIFDKDFSFDVIEILGEKITHIKNAFY